MSSNILFYLIRNVHMRPCDLRCVVEIQFLSLSGFPVHQGLVNLTRMCLFDYL